MARVRYIACALLLLCPLALSRHDDDDFAFDNNDDFQIDLAANHSDVVKHGLKRLWGVPDTVAYVGHLFRMEIPKEAFTGDVQYYRVRSEDGRRTPGWLAVDSRHGLISGIPQREDLGSHSFTVTAHGKSRDFTASDSFTVEVKRAEERPLSKYGSCSVSENRLVMTILVDGAFHQIAPRQRIRALMELASFMALDGDEFWMEPYKVEPTSTQSVLMSGAGSTTKRRGDATTAIYFNVGCGEKLWTRHKVLVTGVREQARDGTLAHTLRLPVIGWRLVANVPKVTRINKRQSPLDDGSGAYETNDADYSGYDDDGYDDDNVDDDDDYTRIDAVPELEHNKVKITPYSETVPGASDVTFTRETPPTPRGRGDKRILIVPDNVPTTTEAEMQTVIIRASNELPPLSSSEAPTSVSSPPSTSSDPPTELSTAESTVYSSTQTSPMTPATVSSAPTTIITPRTTTVAPPTTTSTTTSTTLPPETTVQEVTTEETPTSTDRMSTIIGRTTETVTFARPVNQPPVLSHHMKKQPITAGKAFRLIIPADLFTDPEDGSNLTFSMYDAENKPLSPDSWVQFIPKDREVYGLPLESHVSRWNFVVEAQDSEGLSAKGPLDITVRQHKGARTINHEFIMEFQLIRNFTNAIDWQIRALEAIVNLFRSTDMDNLTVLNATQNGDICTFVWTNDTLPKDTACPIEEIKGLMKIMESQAEEGAPSAGLISAMQPALSVRRVRWRGAGVCRVRPAPPADTYPPVCRNQVDLLTAARGRLLRYAVPEDTFSDPEDGGTRNLALSLRFSNRSEIPASHWLQFDEKNQEFYGLPGESDVGNNLHYLLIAEDSSKKIAYDSLIVEVVKAPTIRPTVEFQMTLEYPFNNLAYNANTKRKVVEKLAELFGQKDTSDIRIQSITANPTTIVWYNLSLPMDRCPKKEIEELRKMIIADDKGSMGVALKEHVDHIFDKDFKVMSIRLIPLGLCAEQNTKVPKQMSPIVPGSTNVLDARAGAADHNDYLVTFVIPAVVIACMILVAGIIACVLYRRRKTGKMSVGDEEERQMFRSKPPIIFNDELDDRNDTEPVHKSPVIMREEKPPLLPPAPDYRGGDDAPYRPPPPFAASRTPPRPKATPTYRKPPPYVPP